MDDQAIIDVRREQAELVIVCSGQLDLHNSMELKESIETNMGSAESITVDLSDVTFVDTAVLQYLATGSRALLRRDKRLKVITTQGSHPQRTLDIVGFSAIMDIEIKEQKTGEPS